MMEEERKQKTLERARALTKLGLFRYYEEFCYEKDSSDLAKNTLDWFSLGYGMRLSKDARIERDGKIFRDKFTKQIKDLIQREPRLEKNDDGSWTIYYC